MPPGLRKPKQGGRGSNQYRTRGTSTARSLNAEQSAALRDALDIETVAASFTPPPAGPMRCFTDEHKQQRRQAKRSAKSADPETLARWAANPDPDLRASMAESVTCPTELLEHFAYDDDRRVRHAAATNPNCPLPTLEQMAQDIPYWVMQNPALPPELIDRIYATNPLGRAADVARHPNTSPETLRHIVDTWTDNADLGTRQHIGIIHAALTNPNCPADTVNQWATDPDEDIRRAAAQTPKITAANLAAIVYTDKKTHTAWTGVVLNPDADADMMRHLAANGNWLVRRGVAGHPNTPATYSKPSPKTRQRKSRNEHR